MQPEWRLAISSAFARPSRTALLVGAVLLSAAMIAAVSCAMASINRAVGAQLDSTVGRAELRIKSAARNGSMPPGTLAVARSWPQTAEATGRASGSLTMLFERDAWVKQGAEGLFQFKRVECVGTAMGTGIDPVLEPRFRAVRLVAGRLPTAADEVAIDQAVLNGFGEVTSGNFRVLGDAAGDAGSGQLLTAPQNAKAAAEANLAKGGPTVGDTLSFFRLLRSPIRMKVVGVVARPPLGGRWQCYLTIEGLAALKGPAGAQLSEIDIILKPEEAKEPAKVADVLRPTLGENFLLQTTERITSGLEQNMKSNQLGFVLATVMAFLAASFIIMTGLSTGLTEKQRELAVLRCIGATRWQLARTQLLGGAIVGTLGGVLGLPLGVFFAWVMSVVFAEQLPTGLDISVGGLAVAMTGAVLCGLIGGAFPAWKATRVSPLEGLSVRAVAPRLKTVMILLVTGIGLLIFEVAVVFLPSDSQVVFWLYALMGLPAMFAGYFLLGTPVLLAMVGLFGRGLSALLRLPKGLLVGTIRATPFRYGFTASAMMSGLAIMVALWTQGRSIVDDWLGKFEFPDAFVTGLNLTPEAKTRLEAMPFVTGTCAITLQPIDTDAFGVHALQKFKTMFIAFEPEPFFKMTRLTWVEPTTPEGQARAIQRLKEGGAVIVAREFQVTQGTKLGDSFKASNEGQSYDMEVVGVVTSPGLEVVSKFFAIGDDFTEQAMHAVFGSRDDLKAKFKSESINLIQVGLKPDADDGEAIAQIRTELADCGLLDAGSGRKIKRDITTFIGASLLVASAVAVFVMFVASFGVANIIVASIHARQFEFGVLRSIGATKGLIARLVLGEALLMSMASIVLGTALGLQGIISGQQLDRLLLGIELTVKPPVMPILAGWCVVVLVTVGAAAPAALAAAARRPRELLAAMKG
jgi:putative ABC transport system permease protein